MAPLSPSHRQGCARLNMMRLNAARLNVYEPVVTSLVNGVNVGTGGAGIGLRIEGASIDQILNDQTDTASFRTHGFVPVAGQTIAVYSGDVTTNAQLFGGRILATTQVYEGRKDHRAHDLQCVDPTWLLNRRTVLVSYRNAWAADIVMTLVVNYARGITANHITVPRVAPYLIDEITFTNEYLPVCFTALAERIGGHWYLDYQNDLHFFVNESPDANTITDGAPHTAADLALTEDLSQVVTKVIGRGGGAKAAVDTPAGATELPVDENQETWYSLTGGLVEAGTQVLTYAGMKGRGGQGSFVGTGNAPSSAPTPTPYSGSSHTIGATYKYAITFTTASGETLVGPLGSIKLQAMSMVAPPAVAARSRGAGSYPPGMITPGASQIQFAVQIGYKNGANGPIGAWSPIVNWDGNDWEVYLGPRSYYTDTDGTQVYYYPTLEPGGPAAPTNWVQVFRNDVNVAITHASYDGFTTGNGWHYQMASGYSPGGSTIPPATGIGAVLVTTIPKGAAAGITGRKLYRTVANGSALKLLTTIANNTDTSYGDFIADASLGASPPSSDTSGVKDEGQVLPGATTLPVASTQPFIDDVGPNGGGGWIRVGTMPVQYTGITGGAITGIPATGNGSITAATRYGTQVLVQPRLYGIPATGTGAILEGILRGDSVLIRLEQIDTAARDMMASRLATPGVPVDPGDGIIELVVSDSRFGLAELQEHIDATLLDRKDPQLTLTFTSRDLSLQVGRLITVNTTQPPISGTFRIHKISLSQIAISGGRATAQPLKTVEASSKIYKFTDLLRRLRSVEGGVR